MSRLINALSLQIGDVVNFNEIGTVASLKYHELMRHLNILKKTFITLEVRPFFTNKRTELVKSPKIYFLDSGLRNAVIKNFQNLNQRSDGGSLRENFVAAEIFKNDSALNYWRTKSKAEIDFIFQKDRTIIPLEVKSKLLHPKITKSFRSFIEKYHPAIGFVLSDNIFAEKKINSTTVRWAPLYQFPKILREA
ncbi:MAG: DUF4143 domain-containing protein [Calditrichaeota bacterium]|nr:DUF4143 domain-containing protein [Calditrichota bacterium]